MQCTAQKKTNIMIPTVDNKFETFENIQSIINFDKNQDILRTFLQNENYIEIGKQYYESYKDSYYSIIKIYFLNRNIKTKILHK